MEISSDLQIIMEYFRFGHNVFICPITHSSMKMCTIMNGQMWNVCTVCIRYYTSSSRIYIVLIHCVCQQDKKYLLSAMYDNDNKYSDVKYTFN